MNNGLKFYSLIILLIFVFIFGVFLGILHEKRTNYSRVQNFNKSDKIDELEMAFRKIWIPYAFLEQNSFNDALSLGLSRASELGPHRPFVFPVKGAELVTDEVKITIDARQINFPNYLDMLCYQADLVWRVENSELRFYKQ